MKFYLPSKPSLVFQLVFWMMYLVLSTLFMFKTIEVRFNILFPIVLFNTFIQIATINFHLYFLVPNLWNKKKWLPHIAITCLLLLLTIFLKTSLVIWVGTSQNAPDSDIQSAPWLSSTSTLFVFILTLPFLFFDSIMEKERLKLRLKSQSYQTEIRFLRAQLNPHFLFNVLNNIYSMIYTGSDEAGPTVLRLSELMRYMLYETSGKQVALVQEAAYLQKLILMQTMKQGNEPTVQFQMGNFPKKVQIPPLLLVPFFENAFKFSNWDTEDGQGWIRGNLHLDQSQLKLNLSNSISQKQKTAPPGGIGLRNTKQRLDLLFPQAYQLEIKETANQFKLYLMVNLSAYQNQDKND